MTDSIVTMARVLAIFIALAASAGRSVFADTGCTQETLKVEGAPVTIAYCVTGALRTNGAGELVVPVAATYAAPGGTLRHSAELHFLAGEGVSRVLETLDLAKLGLSGTLHLTLAYSRGEVRVEGALLTPGAITIK
ncbi:MAG: hypothetical protein JO113_03570 [Candidatus Eremiobacteraeota bacterium]|nr:hypothetical protein [Candidatus Eremiobacteraeota bacterium]